MTEATDSTALAAEMASREPTSLAVASLMCAEVYNLDVIDTEIQDGEGKLLYFVCKSDEANGITCHSESNDLHSFQKGNIRNISNARSQK